MNNLLSNKAVSSLLVILLAAGIIVLWQSDWVNDDEKSEEAQEPLTQKIKEARNKEIKEQLNQSINDMVSSTKFDVTETEKLLNLARKSGTSNQIAQLEEYLEIAKSVKAAKKYIYMDIRGNTNISNFKTRHYEPAKATKNKLRGYYSSDNTASMLNLSEKQIRDIELFHDLLRNKLNAVLNASQLFEYIRDVLKTQDISHSVLRYKKLARFYNAHKPDSVSKVKEEY